MKLIAETACHHEGDYKFLKNLVHEVITKTKADILKFHVLKDIDEYMSKNHEGYTMLQNWIFTNEEWKDLFIEVVSNSRQLMLLLNDTKAVEFGMQFKPSLVEVHSVCLNDINLLNSIKANIADETKIVLGVGGSTIYEIENTINCLQNSNICLMFGFQNYPTNYADINFSKMRRIMKLFPDYQFGYADHTSWDNPNNILITLFGAAIGMEYIEKHVTSAYGSERIDWQSAVSIEMFNEIYDSLKVLESCNSNGNLALNKGELDYSVFGPMKKAGIVKKNIQSGSILTEDMLSFVRTSKKSDMSQVEIINSIGKKFTRDLAAGEVIMRNYFE